MSGVLLGVDVGGTTTAAGLVTAEGEVLLEESAPTHGAGPATSWRTIVTLIERVRRGADARGLAIHGIGVGIPGVVDAPAGRVGDEAPHVEDLRNSPVASRLTDRFGLPTFVDNDVNALALAEHFFGLGRGVPSLVVLAPGTGFGSGIVLDGRLVRGAHGFGGELGHVPVKFDGAPCFCGGRGCLAAYASGRGVVERARDRVAGHAGATLLRRAGGDPMAITAPLVFEAAASGDVESGAVVDEACRALGAIIAVVVNGLNPDVVVVTGGVAAAYAPLERTVLRHAGEHAFARALAGTTVRVVPGDKRLTMRGAAALVRYETELKSRPR
ncbi:MAG TPA: ROK family protein [Methylomirabilota bacterium]|nr:ROK family protein [Methylomirabilota bacterium]